MNTSCRIPLPAVMAVAASALSAALAGCASSAPSPAPEPATATAQGNVAAAVAAQTLVYVGGDDQFLYFTDSRVLGVTYKIARNDPALAQSGATGQFKKPDGDKWNAGLPNRDIGDRTLPFTAGDGSTP